MAADHLPQELADGDRGSPLGLVELRVHRQQVSPCQPCAQGHSGCQRLTAAMGGATLERWQKPKSGAARRGRAPTKMSLEALDRGTRDEGKEV